MAYFKCPPHLAELLIEDNEARYLAHLEADLKRVRQAIADGHKFDGRHGIRVPAHIQLIHPSNVFGEPPVGARGLRDRMLRDAREQAAANIQLLEDRIVQHMAEGDRIDRHLLSIAQGRIEGHVYGQNAQGEAFNIYVRMIWNYRYGENAANGVITQYAQFRSERHGARQEGKPVLTAAQAEKEAKAIERAEAKAEREAARRARFVKGLPREAKRARKEAAECLEFAQRQRAAGELEHAEHLERVARCYGLQADALEIAGPDDPVFDRKGQPHKAIDFYGTAGRYAEVLRPALHP